MKMKMKMTKLRLAAMALAVGCLLVIGAATASGRSDKADAHSIAATPNQPFGPTAALDHLPILNVVPSDVASSVQRLAAFDGTDPAVASRAVRIAHGTLGSRDGIYAFKDNRGNVCIIEAVSLFCNPDGGTSTPGINWGIGGGDAQHPSRFVAVYSDEVAGIALTVDGSNVPVSMRNNIAFAEFPAASQESQFTVTYVDGSQRTITTNLAG
jgi:hypothetical protein